MAQKRTHYYYYYYYYYSVSEATAFLKINNSLLCSLHTHKIWKRSVEKYRTYVTLSKTTHFLSVFCEAGMVQQYMEAQTGVVQDGLRTALGA